MDPGRQGWGSAGGATTTQTRASRASPSVTRKRLQSCECVAMEGGRSTWAYSYGTHLCWCIGASHRLCGSEAELPPALPTAAATTAGTLDPVRSDTLVFQ